MKQSHRQNAHRRDNNDAGCGEQCTDDGPQPVMAAIQAFVGEQSSIGVLNDTADWAEAGAVRLADLADDRLDAVTQAEPAVVGAVASDVGVEAGDAGADHHGNRSRSGKSLAS